MLSVARLLASLSCLGLAAADIQVGAVRWDAWYGAPSDPNSGIVGRTVTNDLAPKEWRYRLPFFATENGPNVTVQGNTEAVMTQELKYADQFGISFWAFCAYPIGCRDYHPPASECPKIQCCADNAVLGYALNRYLENANNNLVKFSLILQVQNWYPGWVHGGNETIPQEAARFVTYFQKSIHHKTRDGRPIVYILGNPATDGNVTVALQELTKQTVSAMQLKPYYIWMHPGGWAAAQKLGMDALSAYITQHNPQKLAGAPYETAVHEPESEFWAAVDSDGGKLMPPITPGWDPRPREFIDLPWGDQGRVACVEALGHTCYVQDPTLDELSNHTKDAVKFALEHPRTVEVQAVIIGAWNENDEGHWVVPSLHGGTAKLEAVQRGVKAAHAEHKKATLQALQEATNN